MQNFLSNGSLKTKESDEKEREDNGKHNEKEKKKKRKKISHSVRELKLPSQFSWHVFSRSCELSEELNLRVTKS